MEREFDPSRAFRIWKRDRRKHGSPNSAQAESVVAGALGIALGGRASYFGKTVEKPVLGDHLRKPEIEDIRRTHKLLYGASRLAFLLFLIFRGILLFLWL